MPTHAAIRRRDENPRRRLGRATVGLRPPFARPNRPSKLSLAGQAHCRAAVFQAREVEQPVLQGLLDGGDERPRRVGVRPGSSPRGGGAHRAQHCGQRGGVHAGCHAHHSTGELDLDRGWCRRRRRRRGGFGDDQYEAGEDRRRGVWRHRRAADARLPPPRENLLRAELPAAGDIGDPRDRRQYFGGIRAFSRPQRHQTA